MIDALITAVVDQIRDKNNKLGYDYATCDVMTDGKPPPRWGGNFFAAVHDGRSRCSSDNNLDERYDFSVTLTQRLRVPLDRVADQQMYRRMVRQQAEKEGLSSKAELLRALLHMNWTMTVSQGMTPPSANDNLVAWCNDTVYGFVEPARYTGMPKMDLVGPEWFGAEPSGGTDYERYCGIKAEMTFVNARRLQPQTAVVGPFV